MDRLKKVIAQYGRWSDLTIYTDRIVRWLRLFGQFLAIHKWRLADC
jgi:hypothetical protein